MARAVCQDGQELDVNDNTCQALTYWSIIRTYIHSGSSDSPLQRAFKAAGVERAGTSRSARTWLLDGGSAGSQAVDLLTRIGLASSRYGYLELSGELGATAADTIVGRYAPLASGDLINFSFSTSFFITDTDVTNAGISADQVDKGAWVLLDTGSDGNQDPLASLPAHYSAGIKAAAATEKMHFYYGLNTGLSGRDSASNGCKHIKDYCIGAPHRFVVQTRSDTTVTVTGKASTFAFAAYLMAWERMPERTHISAVFDLAEHCAEDIGRSGADDETGLGRLDIGCLAYEAANASQCAVGQVLTSRGTCEVPSCESDELLIGGVCVTRKMCPPGQSLNTADNSCGTTKYWAQLQSHSYFSGTESPLQAAFKAAGIENAGTDRSGRAWLLDGGTAGSQAVDLLTRIGVASSRYGYLELTGDLSAVAADTIVGRYAPLASDNLINFSFSTSFFITDTDVTNAGISADQVDKGAWVLLDTGSDGRQDPLTGLPAHYSAGIKAAAATEKMHFYYGLNTGLSGRGSSSSGCKHIKDYCIGAPHRFVVQTRSDTTVTVTGKSSTFAFAAYLMAWERMPERTHISAVFDLAERCTEDIGASGADDNTGLGRLDIGCLAYEAANAGQCDAGKVLTSRGTCETLTCKSGELPIGNVCVIRKVCPPGQSLNTADNSCGITKYWAQLQSHSYLSGTESPLQKAFKAAGIESAVSDRSGRAWVFDRWVLVGSIWMLYADDFLARTGISSRYTYREANSLSDSTVTGLAVDFYSPLASGDLVNLSLRSNPFIIDSDTTNAGISTGQVSNGAWLLLDTGNDGNQDSLARLPAHYSAGIKAAAATGKIHFYYGLNADLNDRDSASSGCKHIKDHCIGAPHRFVVQTRSDTTVTVAGKPSTFAFSSYLMAWERMPERTHISAVFDLAKRCAEDIGTSGADDDTGLGRLDIGCLAYEAANAIQCDAGKVMTSRGTCEVLTCKSGELPIGNVCVIRKVCPPGQSLNTADNTCGTTRYWAQLQSHSYLSGTESPLQAAFKAAGLERIRSDRRGQAWLLDGGTAGAQAVDLLTRIGVAGSRYGYLRLTGDLNAVAADTIVGHYAPLASGDLINFSFATSFFITDTDSTNAGISADQVDKGAWVLLDTGDDGSQDPLAGLQTHYSAGIKAAAATEKMHFYYGLNADLSDRDSASSGCKHIKDYCIGAPHRFVVQTGSNTTVTVTGKASTFAFAAYLMAWERMPERTHISAVFDLAERCAEDIGTSGADDDTGLGRLDIGCLAYEAANAIQCDAGEFLTSRGTCEVLTCKSDELLIGGVCVTRKVCPPGQILNTADNSCGTTKYWAQLQSHSYLSGTESPLQAAFKAAGIENAGADRSGRAWLLDGGTAGSQAVDLLTRIGVASSRYTYLQLTVDLSKAAATVMIVDRYTALTSQDLINFSFFTSPFVTSTSSSVGIRADQIGAYLLLDTGSDGNQDPLMQLPTHYSDGIKAAAATGRMHFYYGLNAALNGRDSASSGCKHIREHCIGAPYRFSVQLRDNSSATLVGKSSTFAFAAYLMAWERMAADTPISAVFALAERCTEDIGDSGADDDTGLGRLDIGCLAYHATQKIPDHWDELQGHRYQADTESPLQKVFRTSGPLAARTDRSADAYLLHSGTTAQGQQIADLLTGLGIATSRYTYLGLGATPSVQDVADGYLGLASSDLVAFSHSAAAFVTTSHLGGDGIYTPEFRHGAWTLLDTGSGGSQDALAGLASHHSDGIKAAAATGRMHLYYGLNDGLDGRHASANGCKGISDHCIGAPRSFQVLLRDSVTRRNLDGEASTFAFAAYLMAWERMAADTHISAVFDLARECAEDIGVSGVDDDTGLGRLDIGCLALRSAEVPVCGPTSVLVSASECGKPYADYWDAVRRHVYNPFDPLSSPLQLAFRNAGIGSRRVNRSLDAHVMMDQSGFDIIQDMLTAQGIASSSYRIAYARPVFGFIRLHPVDLMNTYHGLSSSDFVNAAFEVNIRTWGTNGPWMVKAVGDSGDDDWIAGAQHYLPVEQGKVHFAYGLDPATLAARARDSNGCKHIEEYCIGVPFRFVAVDRYARLFGTSATFFSTSFAFAAYLMAWERMAANTHISAVFDMALGCVEDIGVPGPDADTGAGRLDIGCLAHAAAHAPSCHPGYILTSVRDARCERFSYWEDMQAPLSIVPHRESLLARAFKDVGIGGRLVDRSRNVHLAGSTDTNNNLLFAMGLRTLGFSFNYTDIPGSTDPASAYGSLGSSDLFALVNKPAGEIFTSDTSEEAGIDSSTVASGAWMLSWVGQPAAAVIVNTIIVVTITVSGNITVLPLVTETITVSGNIDPLLRVTATVRREGIKAAAATGKVHFFYGLNGEMDGRRIGSDGCMHIESHCIGTPSEFFVKDTTTYANPRYLHYSRNEGSAILGFAAYLMTWERMPQTVTVENLFEVVRGCVEDMGETGPDADTGLGRLDIGCLAFEAYKKRRPAAVLSTAVIRGSPLPECSADRILINHVCVPRVVCPVGQVVSAQNGCESIPHWPALSTHRYTADAEIPLQQAFRLAGIESGAVDRSNRAYLLDGGSAGENAADLLARMGVAASQYSYLELTGDLSDVATTVIVDRYTSLRSRDLVNFSFSTSPFVTSTSSSVGISAEQVAAGAWLLLDTGDDGRQDPLVQLPQHFADGTKAAAATGRMHFYYGLNSELSGRDAASSGCKHIRERCIGAPYRFVVELRDSSIATLVGKPSTFAFAAYLSAWERMPAGTHISAVFDIAGRCVEDIGDRGIDDDTGVGRLDIGCLAYQATQVLECPDGQQLTGEGRCEPIECEPNELLVNNLCVVRKVCEAGQGPDETNTCRPLVCPVGTSAVGDECVPLSYWSEMQSHMYVSGTESPLQEAFRVAGIGALTTDRSSQAHLLHSGTASQGEETVDFLAGVGVASSQYTYNDLSGMDAEKVRDAYLSIVPDSIVHIPTYGELPPFAVEQVLTPGIEDRHLSAGAWIVTDLGSGLDPSLLDQPSIFRIVGAFFASDSNKMHMYYGLDASANLTVRHSSANDCNFNWGRQEPSVESMHRRSQQLQCPAARRQHHQDIDRHPVRLRLCILSAGLGADAGHHPHLGSVRSGARLRRGPGGTRTRRRHRGREAGHRLPGIRGNAGA